MAHTNDESYVIAVDIGGTFTDCVILGKAGRVSMGKAFSTPPDFSKGIIDAIEAVVRETELDVTSLLEATSLFLHSTTVAENALVDGTLSEAILLTTSGHEDTLRATRGGYGRWSGLSDDEKRNVIETDKPAPIIERSATYGVDERVDSHGTILRPVDAESIRETVKNAIAAHGEANIEALGVSFLWSFANPENEDAVKQIVNKEFDDLFVTSSHELAPFIGEYERTATVALNVRLGPVVKRYLDQLTARLQGLNFGGSVLVMQGYGGLLPLETAKQRPVGLLESGPISGLVGAADQGRTMDLNNIIAADMGGTTFKTGVVRDGLIEYQREPMVLRYHYKLPKMDLVSLGLAGGSVIQVHPKTGLPEIGPKSAGSYPGPVCYNHGGEEPTITDVDAILGYLNPKYFVGGKAELNIEKAARIFKEKVAEPLGLDLMEGAAAIYDFANNLFFDLLHKATVQRGIDPRRFALFSFGGTAGMHVAEYGRALGVDPIVVPRAASVQGAYGLALSDVVHEEQITKPLRVPADVGEVQEILASLSSSVTSQLEQDGFDPHTISSTFSVDMSYRRQVHLLTVPVELPMGGDLTALTQADLEATEARFERLYREKYGAGSGYRDAGIEYVTFRVRAVGPLPKPQVTADALAGADPGQALIERREAWVAQHARVESVPGIDFEKLLPGNVIKGPAIVWTPITTVVVSPSQIGEIDQHRNFILWTAEGTRADELNARLASTSTHKEASGDDTRSR